MLSKKERLSRVSFPKKRAQLRHNFTWGAVSFYPSKTLHVGVVVSKKVLKRAVDRNKVRRRLYEAAKNGLKEETGTFICIPRSEVLTISFKTLENDFSTL
ncbi:MAG: ribonuclease P protein component [Patescibacteria group bacterium]